MADNFRGLTTGATLGRELPFSQEAEEAVLGGVLRDPSVLPKVIEILKPESFYRPQHQQLFSIIMRMFSSNTFRFMPSDSSMSVPRSAACYHGN